MSMKTKLYSLIAAGLFAVGALGVATFYGLGSMKTSLDDIGTNRMPSVEALLQMKGSVLDVQLTNLSSSIWENDYKSQDKFAQLSEKRRADWADFEKAKRVYDALPQTKEEEAAWKEFERELVDWKAADARVAEVIEKLSRNTDQKTQQDLFASFYSTREAASPLVAKVNASLEKVTQLNVSYGEATVKEGADSATSVKTLAVVVMLLSVLLVFGLGLYVLRSTLAQLGGEPALAAEIANKIAEGDLSSDIVLAVNDTTSLLASMKRMSKAIQVLVADAAMLSKAAVEGRLATRADASKHEGDFRRIVEGVNQTLDAVINPLNVAATYVDRISKGDMPPKITDSYNGDFNTIKNNLNQAIEAVNKMIADAAMLSKAAVDGKLATRADASKHQGDFRKIVDGVNQTLDAVISPLNVAANYVDRISKGETPPKITDTYNGDFNTIKNNLNTCIDAIAQQATAAQGIAAGDFSVEVNVRSESDVVAKSLVGITKVLMSLQTELQRLTVASKDGLLVRARQARAVQGRLRRGHRRRQPDARRDPPAHWRGQSRARPHPRRQPPRTRRDRLQG